MGKGMSMCSGREQNSGAGAGIVRQFYGFGHVCLIPHTHLSCLAPCCSFRHLTMTVYNFVYNIIYPTKKPVGVMLGCCTAQRAVQWSLLTLHSPLGRAAPKHDSNRVC